METNRPFAIARSVCGVADRKSISLLGLSLELLLLSSEDLWLGELFVVLWWDDLDEVWHDLGGTRGGGSLGSLHNLNSKTKHSLSHLDATDGSVDELELWLTGGDLVTLGVLLGLGSLSTDLTGDDDLTTDGTTTAHDGSKDVVGGHTDWGSVQELSLEDLDVGSSAHILVVSEWLEGDVELVLNIIEAVSLLNGGLDLLHESHVLVNDILEAGASDTDLSVVAGATNLKTSISLLSEGLGEELIELGLEDSIGNELLLGVELSSLSFCHVDQFLYLSQTSRNCEY